MRTETESGIGKWSKRYAATSPRLYGRQRTYVLGAEWLGECDCVEDWGCGYKSFQQFLPDSCDYRGIDGSHPAADAIVDLTTYRSSTTGLFMRHILEHNHQWQLILENALASFTKRMALVIFLAFVEKTHNLRNDDFGDGKIPNLAFNREELMAPFKHLVTKEIRYRKETVFYLEKV